jgi:hypothetical protein
MFVFARSSGACQARKHHQIDMTTDGMAPLSEFLRQGLVIMHLGVGLQILQALMHKIKSVIDQLCGLFGSHDAETAGEIAEV